jgi:glycosyltransferase involved in cell wall biosynthesis
VNRRLLLVAYPLLPVSDESAGGAEQILWTLERELAGRGWETEVAACAGSRVTGRLIATDVAVGQLLKSGEREQEQLAYPSKRGLDGAPAHGQDPLPRVSQKKVNVGHPDCTPHSPKDASQPGTRQQTPLRPRALGGCGPPGDSDDRFPEREREHTERVLAACAEREYALVLDHSGHFFRHVCGDGKRVRGPVLSTLHLPRELYGAEAFAGCAGSAGGTVWFQCVSESQRREFGDLPRMLGVVRNGIDVARFAATCDGDGASCEGHAQGDYLLWLGRVCPEKAPHLAIAAAERAGLPIVLAGQVYPFSWHWQYWEREVRPRIDGRRVRWVALPSFAEKAKLLRQARGLLVTSLVGETTSLVALEAMASGTGVIAFRRGALEEVVAEGTGYLVDDVEEMAAACGRLGAIHAEDCRAWVEREYSAGAMADGYERLIRELVEM